MSRSNYDKPFYVDVGTSVAAIRCASDGEIVDSLDHNGSKFAINIVERTCDRMNQEAKQFYASNGNAAAMREALYDIVMLTMKVGYSIHGDVACGIIASKAKHALSAPPRNCDRFADELDAQLAFLNEIWLISVDRETMLERDKFENWSDEMKTRYGRWLLSQATEKEGGAK